MTTHEVVAGVRKRDDVKKIIYCVALEPETLDLQDDIVSAEDIETAAHGYLADHRVVGDMHITKASASVVESYIAPVDFELEGQKVLKGSWVMAIKIHDEEMWAGVVAGDYTGVSIGGSGVRVPVDTI